MKTYFSLSSLGNMPATHALLDRIDIEGAYSWDFYGRRRVAKKVQSASAKFDPEHKGKKLGAVMGNTNSLLVLRKDLAELIHENSAPGKTELIPIDVRDHKGKPVKEDYFILNICSVEDVLNPRASKLRVLNKDTFILGPVVLNPKKLESAPPVFVPQEKSQLFCIASSLVAKIKKLVGKDPTVSVHKLAASPSTEDEAAYRASSRLVSECGRRKPDLKLIKDLLKQSADPNFELEENTAFRATVKAAAGNAGTDRGPLELLLKAGLDVTRKTAHPKAWPLNCAAELGSLELVSRLLDMGCKPADETHYEGVSLIGTAIASESGWEWRKSHFASIAQLLEAHGADRKRARDDYLRRFEELVSNPGSALPTKQQPKDTVKVSDRHALRLDAFSRAVETAVVSAVKRNRKKLTAPIRVFKLYFHSFGDMHPAEIFCGLADGEPDVSAALKLRANKRIPAHVDQCVGDPVLESIRARHDIDEDDLSWGDIYKVPSAVHWLEMMLAVENAAATLQDLDIEFTKRCKICIGDHDQNDGSSKSFAKVVRRALKQIPADARAEATWYCYSKNSERRKQWT